MKKTILLTILLSVFILTLMGCITSMKQNKEPERSMFLAKMMSVCIKPVPHTVLVPPIRFIGKVKYAKDGVVTIEGPESTHAVLFQEALNKFAAHADNFMPGVGKLTPTQIINNEQYFTTYKDTILFRDGFVEIAPSAGSFYLKNKWGIEQPGVPLLNYVIYTGYQNIYNARNLEEVQKYLINPDKDEDYFPGCIPLSLLEFYRMADKTRDIYPMK